MIAAPASRGYPAREHFAVGRQIGQAATSSDRQRHYSVNVCAHSRAQNRYMIDAVRKYTRFPHPYIRADIAFGCNVIRLPVYRSLLTLADNGY
jgi:hypothetical protein